VRTFARLLGGLVILGLVGIALFLFWPLQTTPPRQALSADWHPAPGEGEYAMRLADCAACHTAEDGAPFAGGRPIDSPLGVIYSANITPDMQTGIGGYTLDQFRAVLYDGIRRDGAHLFPAMPYDNFRLMSETDVRALHRYFLDEVTPVANFVSAPELPFPFNQRWALRAWKWVGLPTEAGTSLFDDPQLTRGAYLVEGPGHCGACHSPRTAYFGQAGFTAGDAGFLSGGEIDRWTTPDLRGADSPPQRWNAEQLAQILATGRNNHASMIGEMSLVVEHSLQYLTPEDIDAMVAYLRHIGRNGPAADPVEVPDPMPLSIANEQLRPSATTDMLTAADPGMALGPRLFLDNCGACHFVDGRGANEVFPELDGSFLVNAEQPTGLIHVILYGAELPSTEERPMRLRMPGFAHRLSDDEVAALASFVRSAWSNTAVAVTAETVAEHRETDPRSP
jgi:mono/diheme cytochrome c family protein